MSRSTCSNTNCCIQSNSPSVHSEIRLHLKSAASETENAPLARMKAYFRRRSAPNVMNSGPGHAVMNSGPGQAVMNSGPGHAVMNSGPGQAVSINTDKQKTSAASGCNFIQSRESSVWNKTMDHEEVGRVGDVKTVASTGCVEKERYVNTCVEKGHPTQPSTDGGNKNDGCSSVTAPLRQETSSNDDVFVTKIQKNNQCPPLLNLHDESHRRRHSEIPDLSTGRKTVRPDSLSVADFLLFDEKRIDSLFPVVGKHYGRRASLTLNDLHRNRTDRRRSLSEGEATYTAPSDKLKGKVPIIP